MALGQLTSLVTNIIKGPERVAILNNSGIELIEFDATPSIRHLKTNTISSYPVEDGSMISDHITRKNNTVDLDAVISNANQSAIKRKIDTGLIGAVNAVAGTTVIPTIVPSILGLLETATDRRAISYKMLEDIRVSNQLYKLRTGLQIYNNVLITSIEYIETTEFSTALSFTISFEQVRVVQTQQVNATSLVEAVNSTAAQSSDNGDTPSKPPEKNVKDKVDGSFFYKFFIDKGNG